MKLVDFSKKPAVWNGTNDFVRDDVFKAVENQLMEYPSIKYADYLMDHYNKIPTGSEISLYSFFEYLKHHIPIVESIDFDSAKSSWNRKKNNLNLKLIKKANKSKRNPTSNIYIKNENTN